MINKFCEGLQREREHLEAKNVDLEARNGDLRAKNVELEDTIVALKHELTRHAGVSAYGAARLVLEKAF